MEQKADIQVGNIAKELMKSSEACSNQIRAGLFNLIIYSNEPRREEYFQIIAKSIVSKFPSRIIFIQKFNDPEKNFLRVKVSKEVINKGAEEINYDQITIEVTEQQLHRIPFLILPNLLPDLPIYLLWGEDPVKEKNIMPHFIKYAERLIFDSDCSESLSKFSSEIYRLMETRKDIEIIDLNWIRINGWRNVLRQVFDFQDYHRLKYNKGIQIFYNSKPTDFVLHKEIEGVYLAAWLITQLEWTLVSYTGDGEVFRALCNNGENDFEITLMPQRHEEFSHGAIISMEITSKDDYFTCIMPNEKLSKAIVHISTPESCFLPFSLPLPGLKKGSIFTTELVFSKTSSQYRNMLAFLQQKSNEGLIK